MLLKLTLTQVNEIINDVYHNLNIKTTIELVDFVEYVINDDYKQPQINALKKDVKILQEENKILKEDNINKDTRINVLEKENNLLKIEIKELKEENNNLKNRINMLETNKNIFDALVKLHECNALVNKEFKRLYKKKFNLSKYDNNVPNIGDFIENPPIKEDGDDYDFWMKFNELYPGSNNENFRKIYKQIANNRADAGAHISINKLTEIEFDKLIEIVYPEEYNENKKIYNEYRDWLFMFPV